MAKRTPEEEMRLAWDHRAWSDCLEREIRVRRLQEALGRTLTWEEELAAGGPVIHVDPMPDVAIDGGELESKLVEDGRMPPREEPEPFAEWLLEWIRRTRGEPG